MQQRPILAVLAVVLMLGWSAISCAQDQDMATIKQKLGTNSSKAASLFNEAQDLYRKVEFDQGIANLNSAMEADPNFQLGLYWLALFYGRKGDGPSEYESYERLYACRETEISSIVVGGCVNAGIGKAQQGEVDEAEKWFGRAMLLDPDDTFGLGWKAYRNLAISKINNNQALSAALCASIGHKLNQEQVPEGMVEQFLQSAAGEVGTIARFGVEPNKFEYLEELPSLGDSQTLPSVSEPVAQLVDLPSLHCFLAIPEDAKHVDVIDYGNSLHVQRWKLQGRPQAAVFVDGKTYISITSPNRLIEFDPKSGKELQRWELKQSAPKSFAVAPKHNLAFLVQGDELRILNLDSGESRLSPYSVTGIACDPNQEFVYGFYRPPFESDTERGHILIEGRPVYFEFDPGKTNWSQSTLFRFKIATGKSSGSLVLSQVRLKAASNARQLTISADGSILGIVGGGGWRPTDNNSAGGYGILFLDANDLDHMLRFVPTDAYPKSAAVDSANHLIIAQGGKTILTHAVNDDEQPLEFEAEKSPHGFAFSSDGKWLFQVYEDQLTVAPIIPGSEK